MFEKHIYITPTGDYREKNDGTNYYVIWEIANNRPIDSDNYRPYLDWVGTPEVVDVTPPAPGVTTPDPSLEQRMDALENSFLEDVMSRLI